MRPEKAIAQGTRDPQRGIITGSHQNKWPVRSEAISFYTCSSAAQEQEADGWAVREQGQAGPETTASIATGQAHQLGTEAMAEPQGRRKIPCTHLRFG